MFRRLYVHNYRALVNFSLEFQPKMLLLGANGSGKTTILDVLSSIREFVIEGEKTESIFPPDTLTRWQTVPEQRFELEAEGEGGSFKYVLTIEHRDTPPRTRVKSERLELDDRPLFDFSKGEVHLFRDDHSPGPVYPFDWGRSGLIAIQARHDNRKLTWFKECLRGLCCVRIDAPHMSSRADDEAFFPDRNLANFAAWYRHVWQADTSAATRFLSAIRDVLNGLDGLDLKQAGQNTRVLTASFGSGDAEGMSPRPVSFDFTELSDGQRALIGLYGLTHFALRHGCTLCIDEPENYISLDEVQPWLFEALDRTDDEQAQLILVSHHPELLNHLAPEHGIRLERDGCGPIRATPFEQSSSSALPPSEQVARGQRSE